MLGVAVDNIEVRLIDVSRSGCLLESSREVVPGATGEIRIEFEGRVLVETLRVTRCRRLEGAGAVYRLGAEFVRTRALDDGSLRRALYTSMTNSGRTDSLSGTPLVPQG